MSHSAPRMLRSTLAGVLLALAAISPARADFTCFAFAGGVSFGAYDPTAGVATTGAGTITVLCFLLSAPGVTVNYTVDLSSGLSGTYTSRTMQTGPQNLNYNLYTDAARTMIWGDGTGGTSRGTGQIALSGGTPFGSNPHTVYGTIPALQNVGVGTYNDSIVVTVTF